MQEKINNTFYTRKIPIAGDMKVRAFVIFQIAALFIFTGCHSSSFVSHNLLYAEHKPEHLTGETPVTDFTELYPEEMSQDEVLLNQLNGAITGNKNFVELYDGDIAVTDLTPQFNYLYFSVLLHEDAKEITLTFRFDTGDIETAFIPVAIENTLIRVSIRLPEAANAVQLIKYTLQPIEIRTGKCYNLNDAAQTQFKKLSNNTIEFDCKETRFLVYDKYGTIVDDITLSGHGTCTTANAATILLEVINDSDIIAQ